MIPEKMTAKEFKNLIKKGIINVDKNGKFTKGKLIPQYKQMLKNKPDKPIHNNLNHKKYAFFIIPVLPPGLNSKNGLIRQHWSQRNKMKKLYANYLIPQIKTKFNTKVKIIYTRFSTHPMDYDNHGASFKLIGDALKDLNVIPDDNPKYISKLILKQKKVSKKSLNCVTIKIIQPNF